LKINTISQACEADNVCTRAVAMDLCVGCGVCAGVCPAATLQMSWDARGLLRPTDAGNCSYKCGRCLDVCPFLDRPENEDTLAGALFNPRLGRSDNVGYYSDCYVGHAGGGFRERGTSGGMTGWFLSVLLEKRLVEHVICVRPKADSECLFEYAVMATSEEIRDASKSAYYPVHLSSVIRHVLGTRGRYAVVGLPCFIKALRLASTRMPALKERIVVAVGLVCGQTKSDGFAKYLLRQLGFAPEDVRSVDFRGKRVGHPANVFELRAADKHGNSKALPWSGTYAQAWTSGMFSPRACSFCDDTFAELADVSFMDAWLPEFAAESGGTNLVVCRSDLAAGLVREGIREGSVFLASIPVERVEESQSAVSEWKRRDLSWRLWLAKRRAEPIPAKRVPPRRPPVWHAGRLRLRESLRQLSLAEPCGGSCDEGASRSAITRAVERKLYIYLRYLSLPLWAYRAKRLPIWLVGKVTSIGKRQACARKG